LSENGLIHVAVTVNDRGPFLFLLDTGSNRSAVTAKLAAELGLKPIAGSRLVTSAAQTAARIVRVDTFVLGSLTQNGVLATVLTDAETTALSGGIYGVIGQDILGNCNYTLDYQHQRLVWDGERTNTKTAVVRLRLRRDEGRWLVALPQNKTGGEIVWFVPDSGAAAFVVFDRGVTSPLHMTRSSADPEVVTVAGARQVRLAVLRQLRVGTMMFENCPTLLIDRREPDAPAGDGLLPLSTFASVSFNVREGFLLVRERR
jgi:predicted aspartyl protease